MVAWSHQEMAARVASLPRVRAAAGVLFFDAAGRVLLVKPTYKRDWEIPGGMSERDESPLATCVREVREELGIEPVIGRLLGVDWVPPRGVWDAGLMFVFDGGVLSQEVLSEITLASAELERWEFVPLQQTSSVLVPRFAGRVVECARTRRLGTLYLEDGVVHAPAGHLAVRSDG
jgi:8-oxo-dGTP pyrophosphatase MutT (NUDIX family)